MAPLEVLWSKSEAGRSSVVAPSTRDLSAAASDVARRRGVCRTSDPMVLVASRKLSCDNRGEDDENDVFVQK